MKLILLAFLVGFASCSTSFMTMLGVPPTIIDTSYLKDVKTTKHHSFAQLTTAMQRGGDVSEVQAFLDGILKDVEEARVERLQIIEQVRAQCTEEEQFRQEAIAEGGRSAVASQNQLNLCTVQRQQAGNLRDLAATALTIYQKEIQDLDDLRDSQRRIFQDRSQKLSDMQNALVEVSHQLDTFEAAAAGIPVGPQFLQTTNKLFKQTVRAGHSSLVFPVYAKLVEIHSSQQYNPDDLIEIRTRLDQLAANVATNNQKLVDQDAQDESNYQTNRARLVDLIARLTNQVAFTSDFIYKMDDCVAQETSILNLSNDKVTRNTDLLAVARELCSASEDSWRIYELSRYAIIYITLF